MKIHQNFMFLSSFLCNSSRNWILSKDILSLNSISTGDIYRNSHHQAYCINISFSFHLFFTNYIYWLFGNPRSCWLCSHPCLFLSPPPWHPKISILCCLHTPWSIVKFLVARLLREDEYFSACIHDRRHEMRRAG